MNCLQHVCSSGQGAIVCKVSSACNTCHMVRSASESFSPKSMQCKWVRYQLLSAAFNVIILIIMIIIIIIIIIIVIALKGTIQDFNNLLTVPCTVSNTYAEVVRAQSCARHPALITCNTCHIVRSVAESLSPKSM